VVGERGLAGVKHFTPIEKFTLVGCLGSPSKSYSRRDSSSGDPARGRAVLKECRAQLRRMDYCEAWTSGPSRSSSGRSCGRRLGGGRVGGVWDLR